jgi:hypothetical protein
MEDFQRQIPGAYFEVLDFLSHHNTSLARWDMKSADGAKIGDGYSFGEYSSDGKLVKMTGFFEPPDSPAGMFDELHRQHQPRYRVHRGESRR